MTFRSPKFALAAGTAIAFALVGASRAEAFTFTTNFTPSLAGANAPRGDIWLNSVFYDSQTFDQFSLVQGANIVANNLWTGGDTGAASADRGTLATTGVRAENPTAANIVTNLGNLNLNNIIDGEDRGSYTLDLMFDRAARDVLVWERGMNSRMTLQALGAGGTLLGSTFTITQDLWQNAGFRLGTEEIAGTPSPIQNVGSWGVSAADFGLDSDRIYGVRVIADGSIDNGSDFKLVGTAAVPEPSLVFGFGALALMGVASRRRRSNAA
jgi:hypothetical protein